MNDQLTTHGASSSSSPPSIVLKLKKYNDHHSDVLPSNVSHLSDKVNDDTQSISLSSFIDNNDGITVLTPPPTKLRLKLKAPFSNGNIDHNEEEYLDANSSEHLNHSAKRNKKSFSDDNFNNNSTHQESDIRREPSTSPPLVLKINRNNLTMTTTNLSDE